MARSATLLLAAIVCFASLPGCSNDYANDRDLRKQAAEEGRAAAAEEIKNGHPVIYGGPSFGGGPPTDQETGLPIFWEGEIPHHYPEFYKAHNQYVKEHFKLIKPPASQPFTPNATEPPRTPPR